MGEGMVYLGAILFFAWIAISSGREKEKEEDDKKTEEKSLIKIEENIGKVKSYKVFEPYVNESGGQMTIIINVLVSKSGDIMKYSYLFKEKLKHINIKDILEVQVMSDGKLLNSIQRGAVGTVLFGGLGLVTGILTGKNKKLKILLRINDFDDPEWIIDFGDDEEQMQSFLSVLKVIEINQKDPINTNSNSEGINV